MFGGPNFLVLASQCFADAELLKQSEVISLVTLFSHETFHCTGASLSITGSNLSMKIY